MARKNKHQWKSYNLKNLCRWILLISLFNAQAAVALEAIAGKVILVESSYMPGQISFQMDSGTTTCPVGHWLTWGKTEENNKAVHASLLAALLSGKNVTFLYPDNDPSCVGQHIYIHQ